MNHYARLHFILFLVFISTSAFSQRGRLRDRIMNRSSEQGVIPSSPDYSDLHDWASHPAKHDFGDSIPAPLRGIYKFDSTIDVFFIHPTTYLQKQNNQMNGDVNNEELNKRTDTRTILNQASAFNEYRLFAPRYRQANFSAYMSRTNSSTAVFDTAYADVRKAFQYFIAKLNNGHPFFIAAHSQGSQHAVRLISELIVGTGLEKKLIAAYVIGMPPVKGPSIKIPACNDSTQIGCYIAWNSFEEDYQPRFDMGRIELKTVNPLTWKTTETFGTAAMHRGAISNEFNTIKEHVLSAKIQSNRLLIKSESPDLKLPQQMENLHVLDINLFYMDIRSNLRVRIENYRNQNRQVTAG